MGKINILSVVVFISIPLLLVVIIFLSYKRFFQQKTRNEAVTTQTGSNVNLSYEEINQLDMIIFDLRRLAMDNYNMSQRKEMLENVIKLWEFEKRLYEISFMNTANKKNQDEINRILDNIKIVKSEIMKIK